MPLNKKEFTLDAGEDQLILEVETMMDDIRPIPEKEESANASSFPINFRIFRKSRADTITQNVYKWKGTLSPNVPVEFMAEDMKGLRFRTRGNFKLMQNNGMSFLFLDIMYYANEDSSHPMHFEGVAFTLP